MARLPPDRLSYRGPPGLLVAPHLRCVPRSCQAAAHAFLVRQGPSTGLSPLEVLADYDPAVSLFAQLESARQEEKQHKTKHKKTTLQTIIDDSMNRLTQEERRLTTIENELARHDTVVKMKQMLGNFLANTTLTPSEFKDSKSNTVTKDCALELSQENETPEEPGGRRAENAAPAPSTRNSDLASSGASDGPSKISGAFTSLAKGMQLSVLATESRISSSGGVAGTSGSVGSSVFSARCGNPSTKAALAKKHEKVVCQELSPEAATVVTPESEHPITEGSSTRNVPLSGFSSPMKLRLESSHKVEPLPVEKSEGNGGRDHAVRGGRFAKFTRSVSGTLSGFRETTANAELTKENVTISKKSTEEQTAKVTSTNNPQNAEKFAKFSRSLSGIRLMPSKVSSVDQKKDANRDKLESQPTGAFVDTHHLLELI